MQSLEDTCTAVGVSRPTVRTMLSAAAGSVIGYAAALESRVSGLHALVHEVGGHVWLGGHLVRNYRPQQLPTYQVVGSEAFWGLFHSRGPGQFLQRFYQWQTALFSADGFSGMAETARGTPNALGKALGHRGIVAWNALAGSLPMLGINTSVGIAGVHLRRKYPVLGFSLIFFALTNHLVAAGYSWEVVLRATQELRKMDQTGHDFATFAVQIASVTGKSPQLVAAITATIYTSIVPIALLLAELRLRSRLPAPVSDEAAVEHLLNSQLLSSEERTAVLKRANEYPRKPSAPEERAFYYNLLASALPFEKVEATKRELTQPPSQTPVGLFLIAAAVSLLAPLSQLLSGTAYPAFSSLTTLLRYGSPLLQAGAIVLAAKETANDFRGSLPAKAKACSLAKVSMLALSAFVSLYGGGPMVGAALIGSVAIPICLDYAKRRFTPEAK
jgi:hypothetical protein